MAVRHFLRLTDCSPAELQALIRRAIEMKRDLRAIARAEPFKNYVMGMLFEKASTRTRVSFEAGMVQLGGHAMFLSSRDIQLGRGEPIADSARVLASMLDIIMVRTFGHDRVEEMARHSSVPVINALTDDFHPCQLLADMQTYVEKRGAIAGKTVAWVGDGNNMCQSYVEAAQQFDFELRIACPAGYEPKAHVVAAHQRHARLVATPQEAVRDADLVVTDVWASMGQEQEHKERIGRFAGYQVDTTLMDLARADALFMHCLPAHRGEEVSAGMMDDARAVVWDEAENRLHAQKALIEFLLTQP